MDAFGRRQVLERQVISLAPVVEESARLLRATLPAGVSLKVECAPDAPAVLADAAQEQVAQEGAIVILANHFALRQRAPRHPRQAQIRRPKRCCPSPSQMAPAI